MSAIAIASRPPRMRAGWAGAIAGTGLAIAYMVIVGAASRSMTHLWTQITSDWYFLAPLMAGFGLQVGLLVRLRRLRTLHHGEAAAGMAGAGTSTLGMIACCAHHIADLVPLAGASAAATFLTAYKVPFVLGGLAANAVAIALIARRLRTLRPS